MSYYITWRLNLAQLIQFVAVLRQQWPDFDTTHLAIPLQATGFTLKCLHSGRGLLEVRPHAIGEDIDVTLFMNDFNHEQALLKALEEVTDKILIEEHLFQLEPQMRETWDPRRFPQPKRTLLDRIKAYFKH